MSESLVSRRYIDGIYIPGILLVIGTFIVKREYVSYMTAIALVLGSIKFYNLRKWAPRILADLFCCAGMGACLRGLWHRA